MHCIKSVRPSVCLILDTVIHNSRVLFNKQYTMCSNDMVCEIRYLMNVCICLFSLIFYILFLLYIIHSNCN